MTRLDRETWMRLAPLLDEALSLRAQDRAAYVERVLGDQPTLRRILEELIAADERELDLLEGSAASWPPSWARSTSMRTLQPSDEAQEEGLPVIEGYEVLREIGRGGMGVVYHAVRRGEEFEQQVALKVLRPAMDDAGLQWRFHQERRILARLEHPNIARLVDGGTTADGRSYFAMEYVDGEPITDYADRHRLGIPERLRLFEDVCDAVVFSQRHMVIHRDLKPSNILVDEHGRVRLLDFGIARLVDPEHARTPHDQTIDGHRLFTPNYAAPEQLLGEPPTTATDVFSLGIVLYELLCGRHPLGQGRDTALQFAIGAHDTDWLPQALDRDHRVLREDGTVEIVTASMVAAARGITPRALRRSLRGELATITAKCLQRSAEARYPSAEALLTDLVLLRTGQPIHAVPPSWTYRTRKYLRRHRSMVAAATLVFVALGAGLGISLWQAQVARRESGRATRAYEFLVSLFQDAHPDAAQGADFTATQLLERGAARLVDAWPDDPQSRATLQQEIASILTDRGDYDAGARMLREALKRPDTVDRSSLMLALVRLELRQGHFQAADSLLATIDASGHGLSDTLRAGLLASAASLCYRTGAYARAESLMQKVVTITLKRDGPESDAYANDLSNLATYQAAQSRFDEAERTQLRALEIKRANHPGNNTQVALSLHNLGDLYMQMERNHEAKRAFSEAVAMRRILFPNGHERLAESLRGLAIVCSDLGELARADSLLSESLQMTAATVGENHPGFGRQLNEYAILAYRRGDYDAARERFQRALTIYEHRFGPTHPVTMTITNNLATVQRITGHLEEAERTYRQVLERRRRILGDRHADVAFSYNSVGLILHQQGRAAEAVSMHREALDRYLELFGQEHELVAATRSYLGSALRDAGHVQEALTQLRAALSFREKTLPAAHRDIIDTRIDLGRTLLRAGQWSSADHALETAEQEIAVSSNTPEIWSATARAARGLAWAHLGKKAAGHDMTETAWKRLIEEYGRDDDRTRTALGFLEEIAQQ